MVPTRTAMFYLEDFVSSIGVNAEEEGRKAVSQSIKLLILFDLSVWFEYPHKAPPEQVMNHRYRRLRQKYLLPKLFESGLENVNNC